MIIIFVIGIAILIWLLYRLYKKGLRKYSDKPREDYIDKNGYERDGYDGRLTHRKMAYEYLYDYPKKHNQKFRHYDVHHIDGNKLNNSKDNLKILTREEHKTEHGF